MKSRLIALSAISAGLVAIPLIVGAVFEFSDIFALIVSSVFVTLPLYLKSYKGSYLAYLAGGIVGLICGGLANITSIVFPAYFAFFGIYPIVKCKMVEKSFNKYLGFVLGLVWCIAVAYGIYYYYLFVAGGVFDGLPQWLEDYAVYGVALFALVFFVIFDRFIVVMRFFIDKYLGRIIK